MDILPRVVVQRLDERQCFRLIGCLLSRGDHLNQMFDSDHNAGIQFVDFVADVALVARCQVGVDFLK